MVTLQLRQRGKFSGKASLLLGDRNPAYVAPVPTVNGMTVEQWNKAKAKANWDRSVAEGKRLMVEVAKALGHADEPAALDLVYSNRFAVAAYLTTEKAKREHRFCRMSEGEQELEAIEAELIAKAYASGKQVPDKPVRK
jgi:hypothetical protein